MKQTRATLPESDYHLFELYTWFCVTEGLPGWRFPDEEAAHAFLMWMTARQVWQNDTYPEGLAVLRKVAADWGEA